MSAGFANQLQRWGPGRVRRPLSLVEARSYCRHLALTHYENFAVASMLLPRRLMRHFHHVYAYCRWADDLADETAAEALHLLGWWREELLACYDGQPTHPVMIALQETIREFTVPPQPFLDLLSAFEQDQRVKRYHSFDQLLGYCRYSANPVGHLVLYLLECHDAERARLADHICTALQLANFWQDVGRDLAIGRVYLPKEDRERFGYKEEDLEARRYGPAFVELMRLEVDRTRDLFERGRPLINKMPKGLRVIDLFVQSGLEVLRRIERCRYDVWRHRPTIGRLSRAYLLLRATLFQPSAKNDRRNPKSEARNPKQIQNPKSQ